MVGFLPDRGGDGKEWIMFFFEAETNHPLGGKPSAVGCLMGGDEDDAWEEGEGGIIFCVWTLITNFWFLLHFYNNLLFLPTTPLLSSLSLVILVVLVVPF